MKIYVLPKNSKFKCNVIIIGVVYFLGKRKGRMGFFSLFRMSLWTRPPKLLIDFSMIFSYLFFSCKQSLEGNLKFTGEFFRPHALFKRYFPRFTSIKFSPSKLNVIVFITVFFWVRSYLLIENGKVTSQYNFSKILFFTNRIRIGIDTNRHSYIGTY